MVDANVSNARTTTNEVLRYLRTNSTVFSDNFVGNITDIFNEFVNIDAYKDNNNAFRRGSNFYFRIPHSTLEITSKLSHFKTTIRNVMNDLKKKI